MEGYTTLSQSKYRDALSGMLTPEGAADALCAASDFRTLPEKLLKFYDGDADALKALLRTRFNETHADPKERESIRKNLTNWFSTVKGIDDRTISRPYAIEICFILGLPLERADALMRALTGEGLHYRNRDEFVVSYALRQRMSYEQLLRLRERVGARVGAAGSRGAVGEGYTRASYDALSSLCDEEALVSYLREHENEFSAYRNTAYEYFSDMMDVLQNEGTGATVEELVERNLYRGLVEKRGRLSELEKVIRAGWPEKTQLSKMKARETPVTRKALILLFLASCGGISVKGGGEALSEWDDDPDADDADFQTMFIQLNAMLMECGFAVIDPRAPFDWMILFCMATGDVFDLDERFEGVLSKLYGNEEQDGQA